MIPIICGFRTKSGKGGYGVSRGGGGLGVCGIFKSSMKFREIRVWGVPACVYFRPEPIVFLNIFKNFSSKYAFVL
jgi:hypothetical protein